MPKSKSSAFLSVLLVFASGLAMGAVGYRLYTVKSAPSIANAGAVSAPNKKQPSPEEFRKRVISQLNDTLKLDPQQLSEVQKLYDEQHDAFMKIHDKYQSQIDEIHRANDKEGEQIHEQYVVKIKALLRPDQQPLYDKWNADRAAAIAKKKQEHKDHPDSKGRGPRPPYPLP